MEKRYSDFIDEISANELYDRMIQYGLFSEKLPPIFDATDFLSYCKQPSRPLFTKKWYPYASYDSMRNINIPRPIGIPTPMAHELLCACLRDNWSSIQDYFRQKTSNQTYIISRIHIRKMKNTSSLFEMNYKNWRTDGTPAPDISIGKKYLVKADISKCFPSIYSHAISWALVSKDTAKSKNNDSSFWCNILDKAITNEKNGETHGLLIGPYTSNLLSEIILCAIDYNLCSKWNYIRNIDDYSCYVDTMEEANEFLIELNQHLKFYGLSLNHKKTEIYELPIGEVEQWVHQIQHRIVYFEKFKPYVDYNEVQEFIDFCIELMSNNKENASILFFAIKVLSRHTLTPNAKSYVVKKFISLSLIYPYIVPLLEEYVFIPFISIPSEIEKYINMIYDHYLPKNYYESVAYALYLAAKYKLSIFSFDINIIISKNDCILLLCSLIYCRRQKMNSELEVLKNHAKTLKSNKEMNEFWPFIYECLTVGLLTENWKNLKKASVSFLKKEFRS